MTTNKHAIIRYQTLDKCFRNFGKRYFIKDLIEACSKAIYDFSGIDSGISRRQVLDDIKFMESEQGWDISLERIRDGHRVYYRYEDSNYSINNQPLNETEANQLKEALYTLSRFKGMPQFEWVEEISARLDSGLGLSNDNRKIIEFDQNSYLKGLEHISTLYNAILYKKTVKVEYQSYKQEFSQGIDFHPYFLKQYNNRWFVFGINDIDESLLNLALDRINKINDSLKDYKENSVWDFEEYFEDIIGVTKSEEGEIQQIELQIHNELLPYIRTKPLHGSQKVNKLGEVHSIITLKLIPNYELESLLLSYGEGVTVIKPESLKEKLRKRLEKSIAYYTN